MKSLTKSIISIISLLLLISYSCSADPIELEHNIFKKIVLTEDETQILLPISTQTKKMIVDVALTHPSDYNITLNQYYDNDEPASFNEIIDLLNSNEFHLNEKEMYIHPKRRLSTFNFTANQSGLIDKEDLVLGQSRITLNLVQEQEMKKIALTIFKNENVTTNSTIEKAIFVRYKLVEEAEKAKYELNNIEVEVKKEKDMLSIKFGGVKQLVKDRILTNFSSVYTINLFDKETLTSKLENVYLYELDGLKGLLSKSIKLKGEATKTDNFIKIKAPLNEKKDQVLLINAKVKNGDEEEQILHYEINAFKVEEESGERVWPEDKEKENVPTNKKKPNYREENAYILYIIMGSFGGIVILTFLIVLVYIKLNGDKPNIEEDNDYKDIGKIEPNSNKETDKGNVNEEEE